MCKFKVGDLVYQKSSRKKGIVIDLDHEGDPVVFWFLSGRCYTHLHIQLKLYSRA
jgi:hypothetical protein